MAFDEKDPRLVPYGSTNLGMPLILAEGLLVPNERFFVRSNGGTPSIGRDEWRLTISGHVENPLTLDFNRLAAMPGTDLVAFLECTGNGRSRFVPEAEGTPWRNDAIGNAAWRGVPLRNVLDLAGVKPGAIEVISQGADLADMRRGLPIGDAMMGGALLVYEMNGTPLPAAHGGPVRLLAPGWAGIASTKWLVGLEVSVRPFTGTYQGENYTFFDERGDAVAPIQKMPVKSLIAWPEDGATVDAGEQAIRGYAWSGLAGVDRVEVSVDGGESWLAAEIVDRAGPESWVHWRHRWQAEPGTWTLRVRATDQRGITQPVKARWNTKGYLMNEIHAITVQVR